jgi:hypothetical protein
MLRQRLTACRISESRAQAEVTDSRAATAAALQSRGRLAAHIVEAAAEDRSHQCVSQTIANDPQVIKWARRETGEDG